MPRPLITLDEVEAALRRGGDDASWLRLPQVREYVNDVLWRQHEVRAEFTDRETLGAYLRTVGTPTQNLRLVPRGA